MDASSTGTQVQTCTALLRLVPPSSAVVRQQGTSQPLLTHAPHARTYTHTHVHAQTHTHTPRTFEADCQLSKTSCLRPHTLVKYVSKGPNMSVGLTACDASSACLDQECQAETSKAQQARGTWQRHSRCGCDINVPCKPRLLQPHIFCKPHILRNPFTLRMSRARSRA